MNPERRTAGVDWTAIKARLAGVTLETEDQDELDRLFNERARSLAQSQREHGRGGTEHLRFQVAEVSFAVDLVEVHTVLAAPHVARIPGAPSHLGHVVYCDGRVVPILDLGPLMGRAQLPTEELARRRILVARAGEQLLGLAVGSALEIVPVDGDRLTPAPKGSWSHDVSRGVTDALTTILDLPRLWNSAEQRSKHEENSR